MIGKVRLKKLNASMLEIICTLGILVVVSVFLLRLFLGANSLETKARDISKACILAENIADTIKGYQTMDEAIQSLKLVQIQNNYATAIYERYYDADWKPRKKPGKYRVVVTVEHQQMGNNILYDVDILVKNEKKYAVIENDAGHELASLHVSSYK